MALRILRFTEGELINGCMRGDKNAQRQLFEMYSSKMYGVCYRYVKDAMHAEDILVTGFTKIFEKISQFKREGSFEGWIRRVMVNESLTYLRKSRAMSIEVELEYADRQPDYDNLSDHLEAEDLLAMIESLPPGYRLVFNMYAIDGYSHKEIAEQLGISENTSKSQLSRARTHLQKILADHEESLQSKLNDDEGSATR